MMISKSESIRTLIDSASGIHLTIYLKNRDDIDDLKNQIQEAIASVESQLSPIMTEDMIRKFVDPIMLFHDDSKRLANFKGSIGIFRTERSFRVLNLPVNVEESCIVASTFHVKPLLKWMQVDREFLLLGAGIRTLTLYQGDTNSFRACDEFILPMNEIGDPFNSHSNRGQFTDWLNERLVELSPKSGGRLFIAGRIRLAKTSQELLKSYGISVKRIAPSFDLGSSFEVVYRIRNILNNDAARIYKEKLSEFHAAIERNEAKGNVFTIAKAAVEGRVKKLLIAEEVEIFGKFDSKSGQLKITGHNLDHEDDDILDDIAQTVLAHGGEVLLAPKEIIPEGRPILAVVRTPGSPNDYRTKKSDEPKEPLRELNFK